MLFYLFGEQLNLQYIFVQFGNGNASSLREMVNFIYSKVFIHKKSKKIRILLRSKWNSQFDSFIRKKSRRLGLSLYYLYPNKAYFLLLLLKMLEQKIGLDTFFIHKIVKIGFCRHLIHNFKS